MNASNAPFYDSATALAVQLDDAAKVGAVDTTLLRDCALLIKAFADECEARQSDPVALGPLAHERLNFEGIAQLSDLLLRGAFGEPLPANAISNAANVMRVLSRHHTWLHSQPSTGDVFSRFPELEGQAAANEA